MFRIRWSTPPHYTDLICVKDWGAAWNLPFHHRDRITLPHKGICAWLISKKPLRYNKSKVNHNNRHCTVQQCLSAGHGKSDKLISPMFFFVFLRLTCLWHEIINAPLFFFLIAPLFRECRHTNPVHGACRVVALRWVSSGAENELLAVALWDKHKPWCETDPPKTGSLSRKVTIVRERLSRWIYVTLLRGNSFFH